MVVKINRIIFLVCLYVVSCSKGLNKTKISYLPDGTEIKYFEYYESTEQLDSMVCFSLNGLDKIKAEIKEACYPLRNGFTIRPRIVKKLENNECGVGHYSLTQSYYEDYSKRITIPLLKLEDKEFVNLGKNDSVALKEFRIFFHNYGRLFSDQEIKEIRLLFLKGATTSRYPLPYYRK